jgi:HD superfamily phosphohydrolase
VCHLAGKIVEALRKNCDDKNIVTDDEKLCLEIAGLCHDLGHGPLSHTWEKFIKAAGERSGAAIEWKV